MADHRKGPRKRSAEDKQSVADQAKLYAAEYMKDLSVSQAYFRAFGYAGKSTKSMNVLATRYFHTEATQAAVQAGIAKRTEEAGVDAMQVLQELMKLAFTDVGELFNADGSFKAMKEIDPALRKAIAVVEITRNKKNPETGERSYRVEKIKLWDKLSALDKLGRHLKLFDKELNKPASEHDGGPVIKSEMSELELARRVLFILDRPTQGKKTA